MKRLLLFLFLFSCPFVYAQRHELALTGGGVFGVNQNFDVDPAFAVEASYSGRLAHVPFASLYFETPLAFGFHAVPKISVGGANYSSFFLTPGLKLKLTPPGISPYFVAGGGLGRFRTRTSTGEDTNTTGTVSFGGGVDFVGVGPLGLRAEIRDYYSGLPKFGFGGSGRQHNVMATAGLVLRF